MGADGTTKLLRWDIDPDDIDVVAREPIPLTLARETSPEVLTTMERFYEATVGELGIQLSFSVVDPRVIGYLTEYGGEHIRAINGTTRRQVRIALAQGVQAGDGAAAIARRVREVFERASVTRSLAIARTEVQTAANVARDMAYRDSGVVRSRRWLATLDARTRHNHLRLNGQVQPLNRPFRIPGTNKRAMYPGGFSDPAENINCRCVTIPVIRRDQDEGPTIPQQSDRDTITRLDLLFREMEAELQRAFQRGFATQERATLNVLRRVDR